MDEKRCALTGRPVDGLSDAIYDDGEWLSWEGIAEYTARQELHRDYPKSDAGLVELFEDLRRVAQAYRFATGRYLQIWGELGEVYAEAYMGIQRHKPHTPGSDGRLGNDWVEIKTISPEKSAEKVNVKRAGNFNKVLVVKFSEDLEVEAVMFDRSAFRKDKGKTIRIDWRSSPRGSTP